MRLPDKYLVLRNPAIYLAAVFNGLSWYIHQWVLVPVAPVWPLPRVSFSLTYSHQGDCYS